MHKIYDSDTEAFMALGQGSECALTHFFNLYYRPLSYFAFKLMEDATEAEELAADAFVKLWEHRESLSAPEVVKPWLYRTVKNAAIDQLRSSRRLRIGKEGLEQAHQVAEASFLGSMIETEMIEQVHRSLESLPGGSREIFRLFYLEDKTLKEIAQELNVSVSTVKSQKARALALLRERLPHLCLLVIFLNH